MDVMSMLAGLRDERTRIDQAIATLEHLARGGRRRRGRPPAWMTEPAPRRGRPPGSKNRPKEQAAA